MYAVPLQTPWVKIEQEPDKKIQRTGKREKSTNLENSGEYKYNRPFYSCVFCELALDCKRGWG